MPTITVGWGEFFDRIACLEADRDGLADEAALTRIDAELDLLHDEAEAAPGAVNALAGELGEVVRTMRELEARIASYEKDESFGSRYVELSRSIREHERRRLDLKAGIDDLMAGRQDGERSV